MQKQQIKDAIKSKVFGVIHNLIIHPLMVFLPVNIGDWLHDETAKIAFGNLSNVTAPENQTKD